MLIHSQPSLFLHCMPISHITRMALQQTVQPTDKLSFPARFCCHCHSRSLSEGRCKTAKKGRKNGPKISTDCSGSRLLRKSREHSVSFWERSTTQLMQISVGSPDAFMACVLERKRGKVQESLEKQPPISPPSQISLLCKGYSSLHKKPGL